MCCQSLLSVHSGHCYPFLYHLLTHTRQTSCKIALSMIHGGTPSSSFCNHQKFCFIPIWISVRDIILLCSS
ncbi:hypothetical protein XENTR_v10001647 [Xenopus tropicalis]|nr:hypothetical protein XENTR_v10001647 [Xenopus tropicalis]